MRARSEPLNCELGMRRAEAFRTAPSPARRGSPSPPLEERVGERRPIVDAPALGHIPAGCRPNRFDALDEKDDLLSLPLSSKGGEGSCCSLKAAVLWSGTGLLAGRQTCYENRVRRQRATPQTTRATSEAMARTIIQGTLNTICWRAAPRLSQTKTPIAARTTKASHQ
jgi:hypothetical protein